MLEMAYLNKIFPWVVCVWAAAARNLLPKKEPKAKPKQHVEISLQLLPLHASQVVGKVDLTLRSAFLIICRLFLWGLRPW